MNNTTKSFLWVKNPFDEPGTSEKTAFQNFALLKKGEKVKLKTVQFDECDFL